MSLLQTFFLCQHTTWSLLDQPTELLPEYEQWLNGEKDTDWLKCESLPKVLLAY